MLGGYLEFFMNPSIADTYLSLREELDELIQNKVSKTWMGSISLFFLNLQISTIFHRYLLESFTYIYIYIFF